VCDINEFKWLWSIVIVFNGVIHVFIMTSNVTGQKCIQRKMREWFCRGHSGETCDLSEFPGQTNLSRFGLPVPLWNAGDYAIKINALFWTPVPNGEKNDPFQNRTLIFAKWPNRISIRSFWKCPIAGLVLSGIVLPRRQTFLFDIGLSPWNVKNHRSIVSHENRPTPAGPVRWR
jgi:hypothetical protein